MTFKINVLQALKDKGYSTYRIKNEKLLSQSTLQKLREIDFTEAQREQACIVGKHRSILQTA